MSRIITTEDKTREMLIEILGIDEIEANMILAIERGQIDGDVVDESNDEENPTTFR